jgi:methyltransferase (TIGR00027 family)
MREHKPSTTAQIVTLIRAVLSSPEGGSILDDIYAAHFLQEPYAQILKTMRLPVGPLLYKILGSSTGAVGNVGGRTLFFDEEIKLATQEGITQVVVLGAGYDTRALRLQREGVRFFEVDHPATQADKRSKVAKLGLDYPPVFVTVDFTKDDLAEQLKAAGFSTEQKTFFLWEGVTMYLSEPEVNQTLSALRAISAPQSLLAFDVNTANIPSMFHNIKTALRRAAVSGFGEPWKLWMTAETIPDMLQKNGWQTKKLLSPKEIEALYLTGTGLQAAPNKFVVLAKVVNREE